MTTFDLPAGFDTWLTTPPASRVRGHRPDPDELPARLPLPIRPPEHLDDVWEPWTPGIGQRVRVRLGGECRGVYGRFLPSGGGHPEALDKREGYVYDHLATGQSGGHTWMVFLDAPVEIPSLGQSMRHFQLAAIELEPLEPTP